MPSNDSSLSRVCVVVALRLCLVFFLNMWLIAQFMLLNGQIALPISTFTVCGDLGGAYFGYLPPQPLIGCHPELRLIDYSSTQALDLLNKLRLHTPQSQFCVVESLTCGHSSTSC